ncbi:MAG: lipid-binding SYLF domain-containing protein [Candidatus Binatia bacterium]
MTDSLRLFRPIPAAALLLCAVALRAEAADTRAELDDRVRQSGVVFQEMRVAPDREIPADLLARSRCVAVIPNVIKAAWVIGGRYGTGVLSCRLRSGEWSPPVFVMMTGGSFGLQIGASSTDVVLFFMTLEGVQSVLKNKVKLSGDAGVAAGPIGRETEAGTDGQFKAQIYSYARSRGLFAGVSLSGAYIGVNVDDTRTYYGKPYATNTILFEGKVTSVPKSTWAFLSALPRPKTVAKPPTSKTAKSKTAKAPVKKPAPKARAAAPAKPATTAKAAPPASPPPPEIFGEASGTANSGSEAWGTAAAGGDTLGGEAWGTAASGEASGTAAAGEASGTAAAPAAPPAP